MVSSQNHETCCQTVGDVLTHTLVTALEDREAEIDEEIKYYDNLKEDDIEEIRRKRLEDLKDNYRKTKEFRQAGHGVYTELADEREFFGIVKSSKHVVCHFYRPSTWRCQIVDKHCDVLARKYVSTRFIKINIEKAPYLADKLRVVMLPTLMIVNNGKTEHSIIGFDEMGGIDDFETDDLEQVLINWGVIHKH